MIWFLSINKYKQTPFCLWQNQLQWNYKNRTFTHQMSGDSGWTYDNQIIYAQKKRMWLALNPCISRWMRIQKWNASQTLFNESRTRVTWADFPELSRMELRNCQCWQRCKMNPTNFVLEDIIFGEWWSRKKTATKTMERWLRALRKNFVCLKMWRSGAMHSAISLNGLRNYIILKITFSETQNREFVYSFIHSFIHFSLSNNIEDKWFCTKKCLK